MAAVSSGVLIPRWSERPGYVTAEHWTTHLSATDPIESTLARVRHRTNVTNGLDSKAAGLSPVARLNNLLGNYT